MVYNVYKRIVLYSTLYTLYYTTVLCLCMPSASIRHVSLSYPRSFLGPDIVRGVGRYTSVCSGEYTAL